MDQALIPLIRFVGADALMLYFGEDISPATGAQVKNAAAIIDAQLGNDLVDLVPSYGSLLVIFDALHCNHVALARRIREALKKTDVAASGKNIELELPVYYAPEAGEDLTAVAHAAGLSIEEVIDLHSAKAYQVYAIGFAPGFAYLGELDERIATPRHASPRNRVPAGSVAIADQQTAVYPAASPGGWNLIGLCPTPMFEPAAEPPMPISVGDRVRFKPITRETYLSLGGKLS